MMDIDESQSPFPPKLESNTATVYLEYDTNNPPPPPPAESWTRFVCISDTHSRTFPVPPGDVLLHSGDLTETGTTDNFKVTMEWICSLPHPVKILIAGNHDLTLQPVWYDNEWSRWHYRGKQNLKPIAEYLSGSNAQQAGVVYLQDQPHEFQVKPGGKKWSVYGSPWTPFFHNWAFNYNRGPEADDLLSKFPKTDILLTHGPPHGILDKTVRDIHAGCEALRAHLPRLRPRLHVFGHIHEGHGAIIENWNSSDASVLVNAANWPMGPGVDRSLPGLAMGMAPFQPVIVDLLDAA